MIDLLFVELGAVVTEVVSPTRCTVELFCDASVTPSYRADRRVAIDFASLLEPTVAGHGWMTLGVAAGRALYDVVPDHDSPPIGTAWPGGSYEGVVTVRDDVVRANPLLAAAIAGLPGRRWEYQVVTSIDPNAGAPDQRVRRFHGFHAEVVGERGAVLDLLVASAGDSARPDKGRIKLAYDPADRQHFYAGSLVADHIVTGGKAGRRIGAVYLEPGFARERNLFLPKLPPGAGE